MVDGTIARPDLQLVGVADAVLQPRFRDGQGDSPVAELRLKCGDRGGEGAACPVRVRATHSCRSQLEQLQAVTEVAHSIDERVGGFRALQVTAFHQNDHIVNLGQAAMLFRSA